ncbi:MAG: exosortase/archaeosortase family protein [Candidatus Hydrogenedentes bacterium]|nr:exosortase/archaeosortase family protein [Candidatus Hydrogenedentota bacterium]
MGAEDASKRPAEHPASPAMFLDAEHRPPAAVWLTRAALVLLIAGLFWRPVAEMVKTWRLAGSYYTHGFLIPPISAWLVWNKRAELSKRPVSHDALGYVFVGVSGLMLCAGAFLGFRVFEQAALLPMLVGVLLVLVGRRHVEAMAFPLAFLVFMMPIPSSLTQSIAFKIKILATEGAVFLANLVSLPMLRQGSYIHFKDDHLLIGEVCGGLRSLIALLALGALLAHLSKSRAWARIGLFLMSVPVAIGANIFRIFFLCVVGYAFGSARAGGWVHGVSGILIFVVAFAAFLGLDSFLRRVAPAERQAPP